MKPPKGTSNHRMVVNYIGSPVLYFDLDKGVNYDEELRQQIRLYKVVYLEEKLGYKLQPLGEIISHDDYEKQLLTST